MNWCRFGFHKWGKWQYKEEDWSETRMNDYSLLLIKRNYIKYIKYTYCEHCNNIKEVTYKTEYKA